MAFRVATYNVLATSYIKREWYSGVQPEMLDPARRLPALVQHIKALDADLLCLQEVEDRTFAAVVLRLGPLGYDGHYEKKGSGRPDGCATFFRKGVFTRRSVERLAYRDKGQGHVALLTILEHAGRGLGVANTHIRWDKPHTPREEQLGYRQVVQLIERCRQFANCDGLLVCGDFNCTPDGEAVAAMLAAGFAFAHSSQPQIRSCVANGKAQLIDYIFHTGTLKSRPVEPPEIQDSTPLPSADQPSDHLALVAEMDWTTAES
jgi:mRNA deadenylase 3'-5' endonuclease subunit Ccr4